MNFRVLAVAAAALGTLAVGTATASAATPEAVPQSVTASYNCYGFHLINSHRWEGGCSVASGSIRTITYCSDGSNRVGGWIGARPNPWFVYGDCGSLSDVVNTGYIVETRG